MTQESIDYMCIILLSHVLEVSGKNHGWQNNNRSGRGNRWRRAGVLKRKRNYWWDVCPEIVSKVETGGTGRYSDWIYWHWCVQDTQVWLVEGTYGNTKSRMVCELAGNVRSVWSKCWFECPELSHCCLALWWKAAERWVWKTYSGNCCMQTTLQWYEREQVSKNNW